MEEKSREERTLFYRELTLWLVLAAFSVWAFGNSILIWKSKKFAVSSCGTFPVVLSGLMVIFSFAIGVSLFRRRKKEERTETKGFFRGILEGFQEEMPGHVGISLLIAVGYVAVIHPVGYVPATLLFLVGEMLYLDQKKHKFWVLILTAAGITLAFYLIFVKLFRVRLP